MISTDLNVGRAKRIARRNAALRHDDVARAGSFGLGLGLSMGFSSLAGDGAAFYPTDVPNCVAFWDVTDRTTLTTGTTPLAGGSSPPVVTLAGTRTSAGALRIEIQTSTTFRWCDDNTGSGSAAGFTGGNSNITIPAGGAAFNFGNGLSATFPSGTYSNQVYQETVSDIASKVNGAHKLSQATASKQARVVAGSGGIGNQIGLRADGTDDSAFCSAIDLAAPATTPSWIWAIVRYDSVPGAFRTVCAGNSSLWVESASTTTARMVCGANANVVTIAAGTAACMIASFTGSTSDSLKWGSAAAVTGASAGNSNSTAGFWIFSNHDAAGTYGAVTLCALGIWSSVVTGTNLTALTAWGSAKFGAGLF